MADIMRMPRTNRIYFLECAANSGMEWRGAQLNGCQFTHGMVHKRDVYGRALEAVARRSWGEDERQVGSSPKARMRPA